MFGVTFTGQPEREAIFYGHAFVGVNVPQMILFVLFGVFCTS